MESMVTNGVSPEKCLLNHFGSDTSLFFKREKEDIPSFPKFIITGNLTVRKGHQYLFLAFQKLVEQYPDAELHVYGGIRPDFRPLWEKWKTCPHLYHHASVSQQELARRLASCTAFILPSLEEGFARSLLEAMAVGLPIIATHESGATTLLDGRSARIIPAADAEAIYRAMKELCDNPALVHRLGEQAYAAFGGSENTWEAYAGRLAEAYRERLERLRESAGQRGSR